MKTVFIYALCEPGTRTIRYIGKTVNLRKRIVNHLYKSAKLDNHLGHWLSRLKTHNLRPSSLILKEVEEAEWAEWERRYISCARALGFDLVNGTDGGEGLFNPTPETREKSRLSKLGEKNPNFGKDLSGENHPNWGKKASAETRAKMSLARSGEKNPSFGKKFSSARCANISAGRRQQLALRKQYAKS